MKVTNFGIAKHSSPIGAVISPEPIPKKLYHKHRGEAIDQALMEANSTTDLVHSFNCPDDDGLTPCGQPAVGVKRGNFYQITCMICLGYTKHIFAMARLQAIRTVGKLMAG